MAATNEELNPGESANRPRYVMDWIIFSAFYYTIWRVLVPFLNEELKWSTFSFIEIPDPGINGFFNLAVLVVISGGEFGFWCEYHEELKRKASSVYDDFLKNTKLIFLGISHIKLTNTTGVLHPVDNFIKHFYDRFHPRQCAAAFSTYKRTNPNLQLRLDHLEQFAEPLKEHIPVNELVHEVDGFITELCGHASFPELREEVLRMVNDRCFHDIQIDMSSAAGYPYAQGVKKRQSAGDAVMEADRMLSDDVEFDKYLLGHVWYTTGRARMQSVASDIKSRLIIYAGHAFLIVSMLFLQPWCRFMNRHFDWCGVGFSWMNQGANKFAAFFKADKGFAPAGYRYVSLDISQWDTRLHSEIMNMLVRFYSAVMIAIGLDHGYRSRFLRIVIDMINAAVLMPLGYLFKTTQGMKSGWAATANDNTLLHEFIVRCICRRLGYMQHVLYGDDNFMLVPDSITDLMLIAEYERFGLGVKTIHSSRCLGDVDFLSKRVLYHNGNYYVFRDAVETHARILMPEELDPRRRDRPDVVIAVERVLGHLLDNPFNNDVRHVCYDLLERFKVDYGVEFIEIHKDLIRQHPWRNFDLTKIPRRFPTVPSMLFIEELYGVPIPSPLKVVWPQVPEPVSIDFTKRALDREYYEIANEFSNDVAYRLHQLAGKKSRVLVRRISPYAQPKHCYGFHAARFEFAIKFFGIRFNNMLDFGSHPGACAASALKYCDEVVCVSEKPDVDTRKFCPYVARANNVKCIRFNADEFVPSRPYDLLHDDVDIVGARSRKDDILVGKGMVSRAIKNVRFVEQALFTIKELDVELCDMLYAAYSSYGEINIVKPHFSNPWKSEFMVYLKRSKRPRIRKGAFIGSLNAFLNDIAKYMFAWNESVANAISEFEGVGSTPLNPAQSNSYEEDWIKPWADDGAMPKREWMRRPLVKHGRYVSLKSLT